jgi:hypothetical protein
MSTFHASNSWRAKAIRRLDEIDLEMMPLGKIIAFMDGLDDAELLIDD